jgi:uncharacterized Zn-binding protein involved in type VI secretion
MAVSLDLPIASGEPAARLGDDVHCTSHGKSSVTSGSTDTFINGQPAVRVSDQTACGATVSEGSSTVCINGKPAAFVGCTTTHGGTIISGSPTVFIGSKNSDKTWGWEDGVRGSSTHETQ